jgi:hypothetical protein
VSPCRRPGRDAGTAIGYWKLMLSMVTVPLPPYQKMFK